MSVITPTGNREVRTAMKSEIRAIRAADSKGITLEGYAAVYDQRSEPIYGMWYEIVRRGAFQRALDGKDDVRALFDHDSAMVLGRTAAKTLRLSDDDHGLKVSIDLPETQLARDLAVSVERGDVNQMSFGFRTIEDKWYTEKIDGIYFDFRDLIEVETFDVSVVTYPAYTQTQIGVRSLGEAGVKAHEQWRKSQAPPRGRLLRAELGCREREG